MTKQELLRITTKVGAVLLMLTCLALYSFLLRPNILVGKPSQQLHIPHGTSLKHLQATLQQEGYLAHGTSFRLVAYLLRYDPKVRPGAYQLQPNMSNWAVIRLLRAGLQQPVKIVLHHIRDKAELTAKITQNLAIKPNAFKKLLDDPTFLKQYGFQPDNVLTMFIPNTYEVYWTISPERLFEKMYQEYRRFWHERRVSQAQRLKLTPIEISILASIVQNETFQLEEAPIIAGVFINRLKKRIPLQSDVTVWHALGDTSVKRILHKDTKVDSSYNTYKYRGLPPGPLNVPEIIMIDAVLNFMKHDYLYFCGKEDLSGYTYFSKTFKEHLKYAKRYQATLNRAGIYR
ncbi:MAG: endolytic transglycosylase MltG [Bacteroidota bacterium]